jgi:hypothetical protein
MESDIQVRHGKTAALHQAALVIADYIPSREIIFNAKQIPGPNLTAGQEGKLS